MSQETREFSLGALLSVTTGRLLCESFSDMHENVKMPELNGATGDEAMAIIRPWLTEVESVHGATLTITTDPARQDPPPRMTL